MRLALSADSSWNRWHPTYEQLGERCKRLGVDALELAYYPQNEGFDGAADTLARYGVEIVCVNATAKHRINIVDDVAPVQQELIRCITLAGDLGAPFVVMYAGHNSRWNMRERVELFRRRMEPVVAAAAKRNVTLLLENHFDLRGEDPHYTDVVRNPDLTAVFMEALDCEQIRINFDAGNVYAAGVEPWPYAYRILRDYIAYAHLKDMAYFSELLYGPFSANETLSDSKAGDFLPVAVGDGGVNYWGLLREMADDGVAAFATFEDHSLPENAERIYERGVAFARAAMASSGPVH
jgi:sugar phosphate isomerase/epimerase